MATVLCFADTRFPIERANGLQTMATCHALAERGHDVTLVVRPDNAAPPRDPFVFYDLPRVPTLHVETIGGPRRGAARRAAFLLRALTMAATSTDRVIFTRDLGLAAFLLQLPRVRRPRVVYESHGISVDVAEAMPALLGNAAAAAPPRKLARLDRRERRVWSHAHGYVTLTRALAEDLATRYGARRDVAVIPDGAAPVTPAPVPAGRFVAAYAGHLYPWKGVDDFVRAIALAPSVRGLIVGGHPGESDLARVQALVLSLGLGDRVEITGLVPHADVPRRLAAAAALVLPNPASTISLRYTSPLKLFEYLWMARPIVASDLPSIREVLTHERDALLVPPGEPRALAAALERLAADAALAARLASAAARLAPEYTWSRRAARLEPVLMAAARS